MENKTAEEVLEKQKNYCVGVQYSSAIKAMNEYAQQEVSAYKEELASLKEEIKQERKNAINEAISTIGFMLGKMTYAEVIEKFESELEKLK